MIKYDTSYMDFVFDQVNRAGNNEIVKLMYVM